MRKVAQSVVLLTLQNLKAQTHIREKWSNCGKVLTLIATVSV